MMAGDTQKVVQDVMQLRHLVDAIERNTMAIERIAEALEGKKEE